MDYLNFSFTLLLYAFLLAYALGSIPFGVILTRLFGAGDLRAIGSGNIGATNVLRTGRKGLAAATLLLDLLKGLIAVQLVGYLWDKINVTGIFSTAAALGVVLGHCFPIWLKFRGGKGVATLMGVVTGLSWPIGLVYAVVWIFLLWRVRISSLAGIIAAISAPIAALTFGYRTDVFTLIVLAFLVLILHRANIRRLWNGTEPKVGSAGNSDKSSS